MDRQSIFTTCSLCGSMKTCVVFSDYSEMIGSNPVCIDCLMKDLDHLLDQISEDVANMDPDEAHEKNSVTIGFHDLKITLVKPIILSSLRASNRIILMIRDQENDPEPSYVFLSNATDMPEIRATIKRAIRYVLMQNGKTNAKGYLIYE